MNENNFASSPDSGPEDKVPAPGVRPVKYQPSNRDVRRATWFLFVSLFGLFLAVFIVFRPGNTLLVDPDLYWHTASGRLIWETWSFPQVDQFSHTFRGHPWIARDWLADVTFYGAYSFIGWRGIAVLTGGCIALTYALLFLALARTFRVTVAMGVAAVALALSFGHLHARTQILADPLIVLWVAGIVRALDSKTSPSFLLLPVMTLWANVHAGFTFGLVLAASLAAEAVMECSKGDRAAMAKRWAIFLVAAAIAGCLTPYGARIILLVYQGAMANEAKNYISEWRPVSFESAPINVVSLFAVLFLALLSGVKIKFYRLVIILLVTGYMLTAVRFLAYFNTVVPLILAGPLTLQFPFLRLSTHIERDPWFFNEIARFAKRGLYLAYGIVTLMIVVVGTRGQTVEPDPKISPSGAVDYIYDHHLKGNIYNSYNFGGYLVFRKVNTFIDGRTDLLFLGGFITHLGDVVSKHPRKFLPYLEEFKVSLGLVVPDSLESQELFASPDWKLVYSDKYSELFVKKS
jgi:hypothetical protein